MEGADIHLCLQEARVRKMELDIAVAKSDIKNVKDDIKDVRDDIKEVKSDVKTLSINFDQKFSKLIWWIVGLLVTIVGSMAILLYNTMK